MHDLTLVIPTFNGRKKLLFRTLYHYRNLPLVIYIIDASSIPISISEIAAVLDKTEFTYTHLPESPVEERLLYVSPRVQTSFVALHCDDEFYSLASLSDCVSFLNQNIDYVSCMGFALGFKGLGQEVKFYEVYPELQDVNQDIEDPVTRAHMLARRYSCSSIFAVNRTDSWKRGISFAMSLKVDKKIFAIQEYVFEIIMAIEGKRKIIDRLHWLRNLGLSADQYPFPIVSQAWFLLEYRGTRIGIVNHLAAYIESVLHASPNESRLISIELFETFVLANARGSFVEYSDLSSLRMGLRNSFPLFYKFMSHVRSVLALSFLGNRPKRDKSPLTIIESRDIPQEGEGVATSVLRLSEDDLVQLRQIRTHFLTNRDCGYVEKAVSSFKCNS